MGGGGGGGVCEPLPVPVRDSGVNVVTCGPTCCTRGDSDREAGRVSSGGDITREPYGGEDGVCASKMEACDDDDELGCGYNTRAEVAGDKRGDATDGGAGGTRPCVLCVGAGGGGGSGPSSSSILSAVGCCVLYAVCCVLDAIV